MRILLTLCLLLGSAQAFAADAIYQTEAPAQSVYGRIRLAADSSLHVAAAEGTGQGVGFYYVTDAAIADALTAQSKSMPAGNYPYKCFIGTPSTTADDQWVGSGLVKWGGTAAIDPLPNVAFDGVGGVPSSSSNASALLNTVLTDTGATEVGRALYWLYNTFGSDGQFDATALANAPTGGATLTDVDQEPVPTSRVFELVPTDDQGLICEKAKSIVIGADPNTYAVDFKVDMPTNGRIATVSTPTIATGTAGGITFANLGRDKSQAKFRPTAVTPGSYEVRVEVTYTTGGGGAGTILYTVPE